MNQAEAVEEVVEEAPKITPKKLKFDDEISREFEGAACDKYLYWSEDTDELCEIEMPMGEMFERESAGGFIVFPDETVGKRALPTEFDRDGMTVRLKSGIRTKARWPMTTAFGGVNPNQTQELRDYWKKHSVTGCEVLGNGDLKYDDPRSRQRDHDARELFDRDAGYGDQAPKNL